MTVCSLAEDFADNLDASIDRDQSNLALSPESSERLLQAQLRTISVARALSASLVGKDDNLASIVYAASILAQASNWLFDKDGRPVEDLEGLPNWIRLLVRESRTREEPSIAFVPLIRDAMLDQQDRSDEFIMVAERQQWSSDIPIMRSIFSKTIRRIIRTQSEKAAESERIESAKLSALKQLAYGASHEINNPLANISTRAQLLLRDENDVGRRRQLATINRQAYRAHEMISDLMLFAKPPRISPRRTSVREFLDTFVASAADDPDVGEVEIILSGLEDIEVVADTDQLDAALRAIVKNSAEACGKGSSIQIDYTSRDQCFESVRADSGPYLEISVSDSGPGISAEVRRHLFDPFYSGREAGRGLGFGLSKAWRIVEQHQGQIVVEANGRGTKIIVRLPLEARG